LHQRATKDERGTRPNRARNHSYNVVGNTREAQSAWQDEAGRAIKPQARSAG
jgi:hypothetical protein